MLHIGLSQQAEYIVVSEWVRGRARRRAEWCILYARKKKGEWKTKKNLRRNKAEFSLHKISFFSIAISLNLTSLAGSNEKVNQCKFNSNSLPTRISHICMVESRFFHMIGGHFHLWMLLLSSFWTIARNFFFFIIRLKFLWLPNYGFMMWKFTSRLSLRQWIKVDGRALTCYFHSW